MVHILKTLSLATLLFCGVVNACSVPVFRYALERWKSEPFQVFVFQNGPLTAADQALLDSLKKSSEDEGGFSNLQLHVINTREPLDADNEKTWKAQNSAQQPWLAVYYPQTDVTKPAFWSVPFNTENVQAMIDSPARKEVARRLSSGESVVWFLLESGNKDADDATEKLLAGEFKRMAAETKLPDPNAPNDDEVPVRLNSPLPLKMVLSSLRISREDSKEKFLIAMLLSCDKKFKDVKEPIAFPVFGRGRMLDGFYGKALQSAHIQDAGAFLTGACSCQVKELNPGVDLLLTHDWELIFDEARLKKMGVDLTPVKADKTDSVEPKKEPQTAKSSSPKAAPAGEKSEPAKFAQNTPEKSAPVEVPTVVASENVPAIPRRLLWLGIGIVGILILVTGRMVLRQKQS